MRTPEGNFEGGLAFGFAITRRPPAAATQSALCCTLLAPSANPAPQPRHSVRNQGVAVSSDPDEIVNSAHHSVRNQGVTVSSDPDEIVNSAQRCLPSLHPSSPSATSLIIAPHAAPTASPPCT